MPCLFGQAADGAGMARERRHSRSTHESSERDTYGTVDIEDMAVDEARRLRGQEDAGTDQLVDLAPAPCRGALLEPAGELRIRDQGGIERRVEIAGCDGVALQPVPAQSVAIPLVRLPTAPLVAV